MRAISCSEVEGGKSCFGGAAAHCGAARARHHGEKKTERDVPMVTMMLFGPNWDESPSRDTMNKGL